MTKNFEELRGRAEKRVSYLNDDISKLTPEEVKRLANELQIYKAELEIQNEELIQTQLNLEKTSEHFFNLFNYAPVGYLILDEKGLIVKSNYTFSNLCGYNIDELISTNFIKFIDESSKSYFLSRYKAFYHNPAGKNIEIKIRKKNHEILIARIEGTRLREKEDLQSEPNLLIAIIDITEKIKQEEELKNYRNHLEEIVRERTQKLNELNISLSKEIEKRKEYEIGLEKLLKKEKELNELKTRFLSATSHEFRTPLASIQSSFEILERYENKLSPERKKEHFNKIRKAISDLTELLNDLLKVNKDELDLLYFRPEHINLRLLIYDCIEKIKFSQSEDYHFEFTYDLDKEDYFLDYRLMNFIINNLLGNAVKFSPKGGKIRVNVEKSNGQILIKISDEGIGILPEDFDKIFEPFYRGKNAETIKGTGLGLSIVKNAVELHNGKIEVKSKVNKGSEFLIYIPVKNPNT